MSEQFDSIGLTRLISEALAEDIGTGDITTLCCVRGGRRLKGRLYRQGSRRRLRYRSPEAFVQYS